MENNLLEYSVWRDLFKDAAGYRPSFVWDEFYRALPDRDQEILWDAMQALSDKRSAKIETAEAAAYDTWSNRIAKLMDEPCWVSAKKKTAFHEAVIKAVNIDGETIFGEEGFEPQSFDQWLWSLGISVTKFDEIRDQFIHHIVSDPRWDAWRNQAERPIAASYSWGG